MKGMGYRTFYNNLGKNYSNLKRYGGSISEKTWMGLVNA